MLKSLVIKNFRSLADFEVSKLGRVNLIVGKNNSGKSSVLEALRIYAGNAQRALLETISAEHGEKYRIRENEQSEPDTPLPFQDYFIGRKFPVDDLTVIDIGSVSDEEYDILSIRHAFLEETEEHITSEMGEISTRVRRRMVLRSELPDLQSEVRQALLITKGDKAYPPFILDSSSQRFRPPMFDAINTIPCSMIPTQFVSLDELADEWDKIVFTEHEEVVRQAMRIIAPEFENLTFVRNEDERPGGYRSTIRRSAKVKLSDLSRPVPLNSLGDGMLRVLQLALKIFPAKGGFLLIDEFENGLHYSVQEKIWALLFEMAQKLDIQVFATTHSWDCIESFSKIATSNTSSQGVLFRIGKSAKASDRGRVIATVFDESELQTITQADMEIR